MDSYHAVFNQMLGEGWTIVVSAGDGGSTNDCASVSVSYPGSDPDVISAGGTVLDRASRDYSSEYGWTGVSAGCEQNDGGGGGGCSAYFAAPSYQSNPACGRGSRSIP